MAHHHSEVIHEATSSSLLRLMPDQASLKCPSTGCNRNGVADITHLLNGKLIIRPKLELNSVRSLFPQRLPSRFSGTKKSRSREMRQARHQSHVIWKGRMPQSISCLQSRPCKHLKRNELHKQHKSLILNSGARSHPTKEQKLSSLEIAAQCRLQ